MIIGKVLHANMQTFVFGTRIPESDVPTFGALVQTRNPYRQTTIYGLIYDIALKDDERGMVKLLSVADDARDEDIEWLRSQLIPLEVSVLCVGYQDQADRPIMHGLPPQPPIALHGIECCDTSEIIAFTEKLDFFRLVLESRDVPCDELLAAAIRLGIGARNRSRQKDFALACGRELARLLVNDGSRLEGLLRRLQYSTTSESVAGS
ncbi:MAG: hypothetical protein M1434_03100 [Chloroflexi bacterium]|nr:hypothetical protein [Chloroflexota bacterium]MCL5273716.1 hypothetical protein [Chloroflexota bacterium]